MARYIDANIALDKMKNWHTQERLMDCVRNTPTVDVVEVVRCKDCLYSTAATNIAGNVLRLCEYEDNPRLVGDTHFCSYGERSDT